MEKKIVKDTTKEDHYIEIVAGLKVIYNQNQYLAFVEKPKKKRDVRLEIYIGKLSHVRDQYLIFKCETDSEKQQVFSLFKGIFLGEENNEIELINYSDIERINIVSFNEFENKMDAYPDFFTLPETEEIDASINFSGFFMKKKPTEILEPSVVPTQNVEATPVKPQNETPQLNTPAENQIGLDSEIEIPIITIDENNEENKASEPENQEIKLETLEDVEIPIIPLEEPKEENPTQNPEMNPVILEEIEIPIIPIEEPKEENQTNEIKENQEGSENIEAPIIPVEESKEENQTNEIKENQEESENIEAPIVPIEESKEENQINEHKENQGINQEVSENIEIPIIPIEESDPNVISSNETVVEAPLNQANPVRKEEMITPQKPKKGRNSKMIIIMLLVIVIIVGMILVYVFVLGPMATKNSKKENKTPVQTNKKMICTLSNVNEESGFLEEGTITITYNEKTHTILTEHLEGTKKFESDTDYNKTKSVLQALTEKNTAGKSQTYKFDDKMFSYTIIEDRDHRKATEQEKDDTWYTSVDEAKGYYLDLGYTCDGMKNEEFTTDEKKITLQSTTGSSEVNYDRWHVKFVNATMYKDQQTMMVTLEITNNGTETRTMKGNFQLYDKNGKNIGNAVLDNEVEIGSPLTYMFSISTPDIADFNNAASYTIEIYR